MRVVFEAEVNGIVPLEEVIELKLMPYLIRLLPSDDKNLAKVCIEREVPDFEKFIPKFQRTKGGAHEIIIPKQDFSGEERLVQHIESFAAIDYGISKINWQTPRIVWIPENDEEKAKLAMPSYKRSPAYGTPKTPISLQWLRDTILHRDRVSHLVSPLSFFRIGSNRFHEFHYSEAFLNFYLMLEGLFGEGQAKNHKVEEAFKGSGILNKAISDFFDYLKSGRGNNAHGVWLENYVMEKKLEFNNEGLIRALISIRGNLSHYYFKSSRKQRDSFNEKENESIAWIAMCICMFAAIQLRLEPFRARSTDIKSE